MRIISYLFFGAILFALFFSSFEIYKSYVAQNFLISDLNRGKLDEDENREFLKKQQYDFPNISATTMPLKAMLSQYYFSDGDYKKAFTLLDESKGYNKYLKFTEAKYADYFFALGQNDSAIFYSKNAFYKIPNNFYHFTLVMKALAAEKNIDELIKAFEIVKDNPNLEFWRVFLATMVQFSGEYEIERYTKKARLLFPENKQISYLIDLNIYGTDKFSNILEKTKEAESLMRKSNYLEAINSFLKVDISYLLNNENINLNIAKCYLNIKDYNSAGSFIDTVIKLNSNSGEGFFLKAVVAQNIGETNELSCDLLNRAINLNYRPAKKLLIDYKCYNKP